MKILVINCGSSSIKYQLFDMTDQSVLAKGLVEKIGLHGSALINKRNDGDQVKLAGEIMDHQAGIEYILGVLSSEKHGSLKSFSEIDAVGHRVVHGGEKFTGSVLINDEVLKMMEECVPLAPLHNPPNLKGIEAMQALLPKVPQVGVFDTAFHHTMPDYSYMYGIPYQLYKRYSIRKYGFHGSSHRFVSKKACEYMGTEYKCSRIITCHLGNGGSIAAIHNGKSIDTSMGMTPVDGLIMGTRTGDLDSGALIHIMKREGIRLPAANTLINKFSGMLGVSGISSDMRELNAAAEEGNERAQLALNMFNYRVKKYVGAYAAVMGGVDLLVFTGGIGENDEGVRKGVCSNMEYMGLEIDPELNDNPSGGIHIFSKKNSKVTAMIVPTNEELVIAMDTMELVS